MDIDETAAKIHATAREHGFWDNPRNLGEMLMLATSELAEALEEDRSGRPIVWFLHEAACMARDEFTTHAMQFMQPGDPRCSCNPKPEGSLVEVVDAIIREFDTAQDMASRTRYTVSDIIRIKMEYNDRREHMHGKAY